MDTDFWCEFRLSPQSEMQSHYLLQYSHIYRRIYCYVVEHVRMHYVRVATVFVLRDRSEAIGLENCQTVLAFKCKWLRMILDVRNFQRWPMDG